MNDSALVRTRTDGMTHVGAISPAMLVGAGVLGGFLLASAPIFWIPVGAGVGYVVSGKGTGALVGAGVGWLLSSVGRKR